MVPGAGASHPGLARMIRAFDERPHQHGLPGFFFHDAAVYGTELELIFNREWLFAANDAELPEPGNYITLTVGAHPIAVIRGLDGTIRAFHNICRHRGHRVCTGVRGKAKAGGKRLVCPYHQWVYDVNDGALLSAREMTDTLDKASLGLKPVRLEVANGYIFVCLADEAPEFGPVRDMLELYSEPFDLCKTKVAHQTRFIEKANWKLVWENNRGVHGAHACT